MGEVNMRERTMNNHDGQRIAANVYDSGRKQLCNCQRKPPCSHWQLRAQIFKGYIMRAPLPLQPLSRAQRSIWDQKVPLPKRTPQPAAADATPRTPGTRRTR